MIEDKNKEKIEKKELKTDIQTFKEVSKFSAFVYKRFKLIIFLEVVFILLFGYLFIIRVELAEIEDYNKLVSWKREELDKIRDYKDNSLELERRYNIIEKEVENDINKLYDILPPKKDLPNIMAQIEALVNNHGFVLGSINMSTDDEDLKKRDLPLITTEDQKIDLIKEIDIDVFIFSEDGGYERVKELLDAFERHIRFVDIISFGFEKNMESYSIILKTYYLNYEK